MRTCRRNLLQTFHRQPAGLLIVWLAGFAVALLCSCSVRMKQDGRQKTERQTQISDSACYRLFRTSRQLLDAETVLQWQQVTFSVPDSAKRQYPLQLVRGTLTKEFQTERKDTARLSARQESKMSETTQMQQQTATETRRHSPAGYWLIAIIILIILIFVRR